MIDPSAAPPAWLAHHEDAMTHDVIANIDLWLAAQAPLPPGAYDSTADLLRACRDALVAACPPLAEVEKDLQHVLDTCVPVEELSCDCGTKFTVCVDCAVADYQAAHPDCPTCCVAACPPPSEAPATLLSIAWLVNGYHNDGTTRTAAETLRAIADALGKPMEPQAPPGGETP